MLLFIPHRLLSLFLPHCVSTASSTAQTHTHTHVALSILKRWDFYTAQSMSTSANADLYYVRQKNIFFSLVIPFVSHSKDKKRLLFSGKCPKIVAQFQCSQTKLGRTSNVL